LNTGLTLSLGQVVLRLGVAALLGAAVGLERERLERAAGLRTHALVAVSSALIMIVSAFGFADALAPNRQAVLDPSRVAAQVVSGIGFLGAGVIVFRKNAVRGLTTAASVWSVAAIGLAAGGGLIAPAIAASAIMLIIQAGLRPVERRVFQHHHVHQVALRLRRADGHLAAIEGAVVRTGLDLRGLRLRPVRGGEEDRVDLELGPVGPAQATRLVDALGHLEGVRLIAYTLGEGRLPSGNGAEDDVDDAGQEGV
jgi:putative Mg2+ transporter-C (MgtC) family protein